ncbi:NAD-dependent epimerase/dehydratase family protein [Rhodococcus sp. NPDC056960]|uniref:NAD-dependent epimerase/dehydratase family protein n=1 Tax=Rhodococcus sp. NPDC056960 TaxID=3345982 RepID=UPI00362A11C2
MVNVPRRVVITGASGNVGTALLRLLAAQQPAPAVTTIARRTPPATAPYDGAQWHPLDLARDDAHTKLVPLLQGADAVVHLAIAFQPARDRDYLRRTAVAGTHAVARAARDAHVDHLVHLSSAAVYSPGAYGDQVDEQWPRRGMRRSIYSVDKVAEEDVLDGIDAASATDDQAPLIVTRLRPGLIAQHDEATALLRYTAPAFVPRSVTRRIPGLPVLPLDRTLTLPVVHTDDVADAVMQALLHRAPGAFNIAAEDPLTATMIGVAFDAHVVHVPARASSVVADVAWSLHLSPVHRGWIDLAYATPLVDCTRAHTTLSWHPRHDAEAVIDELVTGIRSRSRSTSAVLGERSPIDRVRKLLTAGPLTRRKLP